MRILVFLTCALLFTQTAGFIFDWKTLPPIYVPSIKIDWKWPSLPNPIPGFLDGFSKIIKEAGLVADATINEAVKLGVNVLCAVNLKIVYCKDRMDVNKGVIAPLPFQCVGKADVIIVLDSSGSIGKSNYEEALSFLANLAGGFSIVPDGFRFAEIIFSNNAQVFFDLNKHKDHPSLLKSILASPYLQGATNTDKALSLANQMITSYTRPGVPSLVLTLTDGNSGSPALTYSIASMLKTNGAVMMSIGVGDQIKDTELLVLASKDNHVFKTDDYKGLSALMYQVAKKICTETGNQITFLEGDSAPPTDSPKACKTLADIILVLDSSGSIGVDNYKLMLQFAANISDKFTIGPKDVLFSEIIFGSNAQKMFDFNDNLDASSLRMAILHTPYLGQNTRTDRALNYIINSTLLDPNHSGARVNSKKIVIVMTDGASDEALLTQQAAQRVKDQGLSILSVGIANARDEELKQMASSPEDVFKAEDFDDLKLIVDKVITRTCDKSVC